MECIDYCLSNQSGKSKKQGWYIYGNIVLKKHVMADSHNHTKALENYEDCRKLEIKNNFCKLECLA